MLIVLGLYFGIAWLVFSKLKLLPWNAVSKSVIYGGGVILALVVIGALNHTTPSGVASVQGAVINIAPNVSGPVVEVAVKANQPVKAGDVLFRIDDTEYTAEVARLEASLASAQAAADQLRHDLDAADADIASLEAQLSFGAARRDDIIRLADRGATSEFALQEAVSTIEQLEAGLRAAKARKASLERRIAAQVSGVDVGVVEVENMLARAQWTLEQTVVRAPADGMVTGLSLRPGNRVTTLQGAINFVVPGDRVLIATLPLSSLQNVHIGDTIRIALRSAPGEEFEATIRDIPPATSEGALDLRSGLPSLRELTGSSEYIVIVDIPDNIDAEITKLGASGSALVITEGAGAISVLAEILFWITKKLNYI